MPELLGCKIRLLYAVMSNKNRDRHSLVSLDRILVPYIFVLWRPQTAAQPTCQRTGSPSQSAYIRSELHRTDCRGCSCLYPCSSLAPAMVLCLIISCEDSFAMLYGKEDREDEKNFDVLVVTVGSMKSGTRFSRRLWIAWGGIPHCIRYACDFPAQKLSFIIQGHNQDPYPGHDENPTSMAAAHHRIDGVATMFVSQIFRLRLRLRLL
jgi:hypothetical protein